MKGGDGVFSAKSEVEDITFLVAQFLKFAADGAQSRGVMQRGCSLW
jgi:hypothetical protein